MDAHPSVTQTIVNGTLGTPAVFSALLIVCAALMGWSVSRTYDIERQMQRNSDDLQEKMKAATTELRILGVHVQDMNAIMLREGIKKQGDEMNGPTSGGSRK